MFLRWIKTLPVRHLGKGHVRECGVIAGSQSIADLSFQALARENSGKQNIRRKIRLFAIWPLNLSLIKLDRKKFHRATNYSARKHLDSRANSNHNCFSRSGIYFWWREKVNSYRVFPLEVKSCSWTTLLVFCLFVFKTTPTCNTTLMALFTF